MGIKITAIFALATAAAIWSSPHAHAGGLQWPITDSPKHWIVDNYSVHWSLDSSYARTNNNYDHNGNTVQPSALSQVSLFDTRLHGGFELGPRLSLFGQLNLRKVSQDRFDINTQTIASTSRFSLGDAMLAGRWLLYTNRIAGGRFSTAKEIDAGNFRSVIEAGIVLPAYSGNTPNPLGNQTIDFQSMWRNVWFPFSSLALSAGAGFTLRSDEVAAEIPYSLRGDFYFSKSSPRLWAELKGWAQISSTTTPVPTFSSLSLLYGARSSSLAMASTGVAARLSSTLELTGEAAQTVAGHDAAKQSVFSIGIAFRPVPDTTVGFYNPKHDMEIGGLAKRSEFDGYSLSAPVIQVSKRGKFFKIGYGTVDGVRIDDEFHIFIPTQLTKEGKQGEKYVAKASVAALKPHATFLRVESLRGAKSVAPGMEARRVKRLDPEAPGKIQR